jgi:2-polyprenyl-3-methyl-5-hydroxy-6-metoxy-1,4-benzoquinol methylase
MTQDYYDASEFWQDTLATRFDLTGVGHGGYGPRYNAWLYRGKLRAYGRAVADAGLALRGKRIADVGCGIGVFANLAARSDAAAYTGFDITPVAIDRLRELHPKFDFALLDIGVPFDRPTETFDVVLAFDVLYHVVDPDRFAQALENLWMLVAPGGHLLFVDSLWKRALVPHMGSDVPHVVFHARSDYAPLLECADAEVVSERPMYWIFNRPIEGARWPWRNRRLSWQLRHRLFERAPVLWAMHALDTIATRVGGGPSLKLVVLEKRP